MTLAKALQRTLSKQGQKIELPDRIETNPDEIPLMYRAQVKPRCSLQYAGDRTDRDIWTSEWVYPRKDDGQPRYQYSELEDIVEEGYFCRFKIQFPYRLFSNCGQDSILRPVLGKDGIPFIPGSGVKGVFLRYCQKSDRLLAIIYCGTEKQPGCLRFHGAYPVGDWAGTVGEEKTHYRLVDVVHPQEDRQVGTNRGESTSASALISLYQPKLIFEISSTRLLSQDEWKNIVGKLRTALGQGLGGKTSTGYGLPFFTRNQYDINLGLHGVGVSPVLLTGEPEFRPNVFKATLRSHAKRLLGGCCQTQQDQQQVERKIGELFGSSKAPGKVEIYWESQSNTDWQPVYNVKGNLHVSAPGADVNFLKWLIKFAYTMGGFGKSWRRIWHEDFYYQQPHYDKKIGCHWECEHSGWRTNDISEWVNDIKTREQLQKFLNDLVKLCRQYFTLQHPQPLNWREAWHPQRVAVYSAVVTQSQAIALFHNPIFKTTPAIGGRNPNSDRPTTVSSVWHRMLPIGDKEYLEIVTVFHGGNNSPWRHNWMRNQVNQLPEFTRQLLQKGLQFTWGSQPNP